MNAKSPVVAADNVAHAVSAQRNHVLRNICSLLALSIAPTVPGARTGLASGSND